MSLDAFYFFKSIYFTLGLRVPRVPIIPVYRLPLQPESNKVQLGIYFRDLVLFSGITSHLEEPMSKYTFLLLL